MAAIFYNKRVNTFKLRHTWKKSSDERTDVVLKNKYIHLFISFGFSYDAHGNNIRLILNRGYCILHLLYSLGMDRYSQTNRVRHNQGITYFALTVNYRNVSMASKNIWAWKGINYSLWSQNIAELSLIFIELWHFEEAQCDKKFRIVDATQCWYNIHFNGSHPIIILTKLLR